MLTHCTIADGGVLFTIIEGVLQGKTMADPVLDMDRPKHKLGRKTQMESPLVPGELTINLPLSPISQQARAESKALFQAEVRKVTSKIGYVLSGDISVMVEWSISQQTRYETDRSPDVDNILKPLIDALVGPSGVMIDDNQVQHVSCHWIDAYSDDESLNITLRHSADEWLQKNGLFFVQLTDGLCLPLSRKTPTEFQRDVVAFYVTALRLRDKMMQDGAGYYDASMHMPVQRMFHRSRLSSFTVIPEAEWRAQNAS